MMDNNGFMAGLKGIFGYVGDINRWLVDKEMDGTEKKKSIRKNLMLVHGLSDSLADYLTDQLGVFFTAYNIKEGYNRNSYLGRPIHKNETHMREAVKLFEKKYPKGEVLEFRSMCTIEGKPKDVETYAVTPIPCKPDHTGVCYNACQAVIFNSELKKEIFSPWVYYEEYYSVESCARAGLYDCAKVPGGCIDRLVRAVQANR